ALNNLVLGRPLINAARGSRMLETLLQKSASSFDVIQIENEDFGRLPYLLAGCPRVVTSIVLHDIFSESYRRMAGIERTSVNRLWRRLNGCGFRLLERELLPRFDV